ncbi:hypothetical protein GCM10010275_05980 [Streptomyces litmocidini]|nr:hypothetical protein GCM10010275_05980 [Streptomyces litmocidini]
MTTMSAASSRIPSSTYSRSERFAAVLFTRASGNRRTRADGSTDCNTLTTEIPPD